jgi:hypothetical protein
MRVMKAAMLAFVLSCITVPAWAVVIRPSDVVLPASPGGLFSFDLIVKKFPNSFGAKGCTSTVEVSGPGILTFNRASSAAVSADPSYWLYQNSGGVNTSPPGSSSKKHWFADGPNQDEGILGAKDTIVARYAFNWDGTEGLYRFTFDFGNLNENFVFVFVGPPEDYVSYPLKLPDGNWYSDPIVDADNSSFTVAIPEPNALILFVLGGAILLKKHKT